MKNPTKLIQVLILSFIMTFGVIVGTSVNTYAQTDPGFEDDPRGDCKRSTSLPDLSYCDFTFNDGDCDGNDGSDCGGLFECW